MPATPWWEPSFRFGSLPVVFLVFLRLIMVPFDGIEHAHAKDEKLEWQEHYRKPINPTRIHRLNTFKLFRDIICRMQNLHQSGCSNNLSY